MIAVLAQARSLDTQALYWINNGLSCRALDVFFSFVTELRNYVIPIGVLAVYLWKRKGVRGRLCLASLLVCVGISDSLSSRLIKPWAHRLRPCAALPHVLIPHGDRGTFSLPSSHAVNIAGAMMILSLFFPEWSAAAWLLAALVGLSRVYLGLHYPSDVLIGYAIGAGIAWGTWFLLMKLAERKRPNLHRPNPAPADCGLDRRE